MSDKNNVPDYEGALDKAFVEIPKGIKTWFLDTCVWGKIVSSEQITKKFIEYFSANNYLAGLPIYTLFELSRADKKLSGLDNLFFRMRNNIWIALLYDSLFDAELASYPNRPKIRWMPLSMLTGEEEGLVRVMTKLANNPLLAVSRSEHLDFGNLRFMSLEKFKENFPTSDGSNYTPSQAHTFALCNGIDYFLRHEPHVIKEIGPRNFLPEGLPSQYIRSLFIFYKYYIHGQSPGESDFLDFAHVSYAPYFDIYATEKNVSNVLRHIKSTGLFLAETKIIHVTEFLDMIKSA